MIFVDIRKIIAIAIILSVFVGSAVMLSMNPVDIGVNVPVNDDTDEDASAVLVFNEIDGEDDVYVGETPFTLSFSHYGGFYSEPFTLYLSASVAGAEIYYTTDGSEPTINSEKYSEPIRIGQGKGLEAVVVKAAAVYGETVTRIMAHTFFIDENIDTRFSTLVFSISTNDEHLYCYETGIFVAGRLRSDFIAANPRATVNPTSPANFNVRGREGERPVFVEVFTGDGERVIAQSAGLRIQGGWSRAENQKSLRLMARNEYDMGFGRFRYPFFPNALNNNDEVMTRYNSLVLRNGANDRNFGMLRNELGSMMARDAGFPTVSHERPAAVFVNGEYFGFAWLQIRFCAKQMQQMYGAPTDEFDVIGHGENWFRIFGERTAAEVKAVEDLRHLNSFANRDLNNDDVFAEFNSIVDVDNLLLYYALQIYMGNDDWPHNNMRRWRYTGEWAEGMAPELDGRWRYIMFDLDWTFGLYGTQFDLPTFQNVLGGRRNSPLLVSVLKRPELANKFTMIMCDLAYNVMSQRNVAANLETLMAAAEQEMQAALSARRYANWVSMGSVTQNHNDIRRFAAGRGNYIVDSLRRYFGYPSEMTRINVSGGDAVIGTRQAATATYFAGMEIPVSPVLPQYTYFEYWLIDGERIYEPNITVTTGGVINITLVTRFELPMLMFTDAYANAERNGCVLINTTGNAVNTRGLFISNRSDDLRRWELPPAIIEPGGTMTLSGRSSADRNDLLNIRMGFNIRDGNTLYLSDIEGNIIHIWVME
jgi:hypothetical protein